MFSLGRLASRAFWITRRSLEFDFGSGPPCFTALMISLTRREKIFPLIASALPLRCLMLAHLLCPAIKSHQLLKKKFLVFLLPALCLSVLGKFSLFLLKTRVMDAVSTSFCLYRRMNTVKHLMVHDIRDKVRGKMGLIQKAVDFNQFIAKAIKSQLAVTPGFALGISKPGDLKVEFAIEVRSIDAVIDRLKIVKNALGFEMNFVRSSFDPHFFSRSRLLAPKKVVKREKL